MLPFLHRARTTGVHRAVLLSSSAVPEGGPAVGTVHRALPDLFEQWAVLRPSWFMRNFTGTHAHARGIRDEGIWTAAESGRVGFVDAEDDVPGRSAVLPRCDTTGRETARSRPIEPIGRDLVNHLRAISGTALLWSYGDSNPRPPPCH
ncbi:hypothetical protein ACWDWV_09910, partial [Streptosporangium sandarakinum]